jgi:uncharacterized membrane protein
MQQNNDNSFGVVMMHVLGFLSCLVVVKVLAGWRTSSAHSMTIGVMAVIPAYFFFIRDMRRINLKSLGYIFLWVGILALCSGFRNMSLGFILYTGNPVSVEYYYRVFGLATLCLLSSAICFWQHFKRNI